MINQFNNLKEEGKKLISQQLYQEAISKYTLCLEVAKDQKIVNSDLAIVNLNIAICYQNLKDYDKALQFIELSINLDSSYIKAHYRKAQIYLVQEKYIEALELFKKVYSIDKSPETQKQIIQIQQKLKETLQTLNWQKDEQRLKEKFDDNQLKQLFPDIHEKLQIKQNLTAFFESKYAQQMLDYFYSLRERQDFLQVAEYPLKCLLYVFSVITKEDTDYTIQISSQVNQNFSVFIVNEAIEQRLIQWILAYFNLKHLEIQSNQLKSLYDPLFNLVPYINFKAILQLFVQDNQNQQIKNYFLQFYPNILKLNILRNHQFYLSQCNKQRIAVWHTEEPKLIQHITDLIDEITVKAKQNLVQLQQPLQDNQQQAQQQQQQQQLSNWQHIYNELIQSLFLLVTILDEQQMEKYQFYKKEKLNCRDLIKTYCLLICDYKKMIKVYLTHSVHNNIFRTFIAKPNSKTAADLVLRIVELLIKDEDINKKINEEPAAFDQFNLVLQSFLKEYLNTEKKFNLKLQYGLILFKINNRKKITELHDFLQYFEVQQFYFNETNLSDAVEMLSFLTCFDSFKLQLMDKKECLVTLGSIMLQNYKAVQEEERQQKQQQQKQQQQQPLQQPTIVNKVNKANLYNLNLAYLTLCMNLVSDQLKDFEEQQKEKYEIDDEKLNSIKQLEKKFQKDEALLKEKMFTYNQKQIEKHQVRSFLCKVMRIQNAIEFVIRYGGAVQKQQYQSNKKNSFDSPEMMAVNIAKLLKELIQDKDNVPFLTNIFIIRYTAQISQGVRDAYYYLAHVLSKINPSILDYKDVNPLCDALFSGIDKSNHELLTFESLLGLVQLSGLGEYVNDYIADKPGYIATVTNQLLEKNDYIVHAALEVINNICTSQKMQEKFQKRQTENLLKIIFVLFNCFLDKLKNPIGESQGQEQKINENIVNNESEFNHPIKAIITIYSIGAVISSFDIVSEAIEQHAPAYLDLQSIYFIMQKSTIVANQIDLIYKYSYVILTIKEGIKFTPVVKQFIRDVIPKFKLEQMSKEEQAQSKSRLDFLIEIAK